MTGTSALELYPLFGLADNPAILRSPTGGLSFRLHKSHSVPPGYVRTKLPVRPKLDPFVPVIDKMLAEDKSRPKKQQHTSKRIFDRLRDEHGFSGGLTIVKDYVAGERATPG